MKQINQTSTRFSPARLMRFLPAVIWMTIIFILSSRTSDEINTFLPFFQTFFPFMKGFDWGHFVSYFILALTLDYGIGKKADRLGMKLLIVLLCGIYGVSDEYHQSFVGGRMPDAMDVRNDMIGAAIWTAVAAVPWVRRRWRKVAP
ncbi:VanZ family protein [Paenibacillus sinopodophylli]|uniref:VanZ family protein n=1 Tax=Paenibacillus sinopodophylli TaxID=1837342 RepID=UPI001485FEEB|nr:VanZ family protein [Paenibacillus sinopodophylli]